MTDLNKIFISPHTSIRDAIAAIDRNLHGIVLVTDSEHHLIGTITDGDIRRALLAEENLSAPVTRLLARKADRYAKPITAPLGTDREILLKVMQQKLVHQIPLVDREGRVCDLVTMEDLLPGHPLPLQAVIMAGGFGTRLRPLTDDLPKPMLPVGNRPLMEKTIDQLKGSGIRKIHLTTHFKEEVITDHFQDGRDFGVEINYLKENEPLGTAGSLSLLEPTDDPILVINGDILSRVNYRAMLHFHQEHDASMTVGVRQYEFKVPYGVIATNGDGVVTEISEKPVVRNFVNAGIYLMNGRVLDLVPKDSPFDMPDLIQRLLERKSRVICFPIREYWVDIGQLEDYQKALLDAENGHV